MPTDAEQHEKIVKFLLKKSPLTISEIAKKLKEEKSLVEIRLWSLRDQKRVDLREESVSINEEYRISLSMDSLSIEDDLEFLKFLDKRSRYLIDSYTGQGFRKHWFKVSEWTDDKLSQKEIDRIQKVVESRDDLIFCPDQGAFGFHPTFSVIQVVQEHFDVPPDFKCLLNFDQKQYDGKDGKDPFDSLEPIWSTEKNLHLIEYYKRPKISYKSSYFY